LSRAANSADFSGLMVGEDPEEDARRFYRSPGGVTLVSPARLEALED
jgi:glucose-1-phosphate adenylyltransferase